MILVRAVQYTHTDFPPATPRHHKVHPASHRHLLPREKKQLFKLTVPDCTALHGTGRAQKRERIDNLGAPAPKSRVSDDADHESQSTITIEPQGAFQSERPWFTDQSPHLSPGPPRRRRTDTDRIIIINLGCTHLAPTSHLTHLAHLTPTLHPRRSTLTEVVYCYCYCSPYSTVRTLVLSCSRALVLSGCRAVGLPDCRTPPALPCLPTKKINIFPSATHNSSFSPKPSSTHEPPPTEPIISAIAIKSSSTSEQERHRVIESSNQLLQSTVYLQ